MTRGVAQRALLGALACAILAPCGRLAAQRATDARPLAWPTATRDSRPWTRWWWMGSAVDSANLTAQLGELAAAGFGGVEVTPIYGVRGAERLDVPYLSPRWVALLAHTAAEAHRLGMGEDMPPGSGWRLGGPFVAASDANMSLRVHADTVRAGQGTRVVYAAETRFSGDRVKRAAPGGEGYAIDPFSREATARYLAAFDARIAALPRDAIGSWFHDSFEYTGDGSRKLFETFRRLRGYDLADELAALAGDGDADHVARVKSDYRQTLDDMLREHFVGQLTAWAHGRGARFREQAHGSPGNLLDLYAASDIPETEIFGPLAGADADPLVNKFASSAAHLAGRALASAESFTWLGEHWTATLDDVKRAADGLFLAGIDHLVYHGTAYSPPAAAWPGWEFYASMEWNPRNAFWHDVPAFNAYVTRVQSVLQQGLADDDVLLYWPVWDNWHDAAGMRMDFRVHNPTWLTSRPVGAAAAALWNAGYGFDFVSDRLLARRVSVVGGALRAGGVAGPRYTVLLVPRTAHMPPETFRRLVDLARDGATVLVVDLLPADVPGLARLAERRATLDALRRALAFGGADSVGVRRAAIGRGRLLVGPSVPALLAAAGVRRDPLAATAGVRLLRQRRTDGGRDYFITLARDSAAVDGWVPLDAPAAAVAIMDPMTGRAGFAELRRGANGSTEIHLQLDPGASVILRTFDRPVRGASWTYRRPAGAPIALRGRWAVAFLGGGPVLPSGFAADSVLPWTGRGDADADRFAGTARYTLTFDAPAAARSWLLDLGRVAESARVRVNGRDLGTLVATPFRVETGPLRATGNVLEVDATSLSANRIRDLDRRGVPWKIFRDINYVGIDYKSFDASAWPVRVSGLVGPVTLTPLDVSAFPP